MGPPYRGTPKPRDVPWAALAPRRPLHAPRAAGLHPGRSPGFIWHRTRSLLAAFLGMSINIEEPAQLLPSLCPCSSLRPAPAPCTLPGLGRGSLRSPEHGWVCGGFCTQCLGGPKACPALQAGWDPVPSSHRGMGVPAKPGAGEPPGCPWRWDLVGQGAVSLTPLQPPCNPLGAQPTWPAHSQSH